MRRAELTRSPSLSLSLSLFSQPAKRGDALPALTLHPNVLLLSPPLAPSYCCHLFHTRLFLLLYPKRSPLKLVLFLLQLQLVPVQPFTITRSRPSSSSLLPQQPTSPPHSFPRPLLQTTRLGSPLPSRRTEILSRRFQLGRHPPRYQPRPSAQPLPVPVVSSRRRSLGGRDDDWGFELERRRRRKEHSYDWYGRRYWRWKKSLGRHWWRDEEGSTTAAAAAAGRRLRRRRRRSIPHRSRSALRRSEWVGMGCSEP